MEIKDINVDNVAVLGDFVLVKQKKKEEKDAYEKRESGILVATTTGDNNGMAQKGNISEIVKAGAGCFDLEGKEGSFVMHQPFAGFRFEKDDYDYILLRENEVFMVL